MKNKRTFGAIRFRCSGNKMKEREQASYMEFRQHLSDYIGMVKFAKKRIVITQRGKIVGAFVPIEDLEAIQSFEDQKDIAVFNQARSSGEFVNWEDVRKKLIQKHGFTEDELQGRD